jgi:hypothetical protein
VLCFSALYPRHKWQSFTAPRIKGKIGFSESLAGGESSAALYSLICMAKAHGLNPYEYMNAVTDLPQAKTDEEIAMLLPWKWQPQITPPLPPSQLN